MLDLEKLEMAMDIKEHEWKPYPLHQPDPGWYLVAIPFHGTLIYDCAEWKYGEWVRVFEDDRIIAFQKIEPYQPDEKVKRTYKNAQL